MSSKGLAVDTSSHESTSLDLDIEKSSQPVTLAHDESDDESGYLSGLKLGLVMLGLCLAVLLVGLVCNSPQLVSLTHRKQDNSILATAIPTITTKFNSLDDVGWYGSAFLICV